MQMVRYGGCQCGALRFRAVNLMNNAHLCHCRMCQKAVGNFFAALVGVALEDFSWTRGTPASFRSSQQVQRGFCQQCGTPMFYQHDDNKHISLSIACFDQPADIELDFQMGSESRLPQLTSLASLPDLGNTEDKYPEQCAAIKRSNRQHPDAEE